MENIIHNVEASVQIVNIRMSASINTKGMIPELEANAEAWDQELDDDNWDPEAEFGIDSAYTLKEEAIWSKYLLAKVNYTSNGQLIAKIEPHPYYEIDEEYGNRYVWLEPYFVFENGSIVDPETYFSTGWDELIDELNQIISDLNDSFNAGMDPIE